MIFIFNPIPTSLSFKRVVSLTWYQSLVWQEVLGSSHLFAIYSSFVDVKVHGGLFDLFDSPRAGIWLYVREDVEGMIFILNPIPINLSF